MGTSDYGNEIVVKVSDEGHNRADIRSADTGKIASAQYQRNRGHSPSSRLLTALAWVKARRVRDQVFGEKLFLDPAWDMLLDLYINLHRKRVACVTDLFQSGPSSPTTILRWIATLENRGLVSRRADPSDRRRQYIELTADGIERMETALDAAVDSDRSLGLGRLSLVE